MFSFSGRLHICIEINTYVHIYVHVLLFGSPAADST